MSFRVTALWRRGWVVLLLGLGLPVEAQVPNSPIVFAQSAITTSFVSPTNVGGTSGGDSSDLQWLKVEFHYSVAPANGKFLDAVEFKVWIEGRDLYAPELANAPANNQGVPVALTGTVTYVNLPATKDAYGVLFVPPDTVARFSTARGPSDFDRTFNIHVEADIGGVMVDYFDKNKESDANWYKTDLKPVDGFVYRQDQTPFILSDPNRYPPVKLTVTPQ
jgi:hypothetical protein